TEPALLQWRCNALFAILFEPRRRLRRLIWTRHHTLGKLRRCSPDLRRLPGKGCLTNRCYAESAVTVVLLRPNQPRPARAGGDWRDLALKGSDSRSAKEPPGRDRPRRRPWCRSRRSTH